MKLQLTTPVAILVSTLLLVGYLAVGQYFKYKAVESERRQECYDKNDDRKSYESPYSYYEKEGVCRQVKNTI